MIGAIADDFTGATDIAVAFRRSGLRVGIAFNGPRDAVPSNVDVFVVALKTRTIAPAEAVEQSVDAWRWLRSRGAGQCFFKYCSTFDSRPEGNIGPVTDALREALGAERAVFVPASPAHLRTQYMGHLFVDGELLSDSHMRHHPLTPMTESSIPGILAAQTPLGVGLIDHRAVREGRARIAKQLEAAAQLGTPYVVIDALTAEDLDEIGEAVASDRLVTGAAGLAGGFGRAIARRRGHRADADQYADPVGDAPAVVLAGSCSARTLLQVAQMRQTHPSYFVDAVATPDAAALAGRALDWYDAQDSGRPPLIFSSVAPAELRSAHAALGREFVSETLESAMGRIARGLVERGVRRLVVAGGETSGAVVTALGVEGGVIGAEAAEGVPWIHTGGDEPLALLLKSGNFGDPHLLARAVGAGSA